MFKVRRGSRDGDFEIVEERGDGNSRLVLWGRAWAMKNGATDTRWMESKDGFAVPITAGLRSAMKRFAPDVQRQLLSEIVKIRQEAQSSVEDEFGFAGSSS